MKVKLTGRWFHGAEGHFAPGIHKVDDETGEFLKQFDFVDQVPDETETTSSEGVEGAEEAKSALDLLAELTKEKAGGRVQSPG